jgi:hypothetical protein
VSPSVATGARVTLPPASEAPGPSSPDRFRPDDVVFVSEHLRDFSMQAIPGLAVEQAPRRRHVVANAMDLTSYSRPKLDDDVRFNLGLVGCRAVVKDPMWALDVLERLRETDDRYRLILVGDLDGPGSTAAARPYIDAPSSVSSRWSGRVQWSWWATRMTSPTPSAGSA